MKTGLELDGNGQIIYLDRQNIHCGENEEISSFYMHHDSNLKKYQFVYQCCKTSVPCEKNRFEKNKLTIIGDGRVIWLDRQDVNCGNNGYLNQFNLHTDHSTTPLKVQFKYHCCEAPVPFDCKRFNTKSQSFLTKGNTLALANQKVECPNHYSLTQWRVINVAEKDVRFNYTCCRRTLGIIQLLAILFFEKE